MVNETEIFKPIKGYEGYYEVSNFGRIKSLPKKWSVGKKGETFLKPGNRKSKGLVYLFVVLCVNKIKKYVSVHRLVAMHFCDNKDNGGVVNHLDSNTFNNNYKNLEWTTSSGNAIHGFSYGFRKGMKGDNHPMSKYKKEDILKIRELYESGLYSQSAIAKMYNDRQNNISRIVLRQRWKHI